jgi:hypothetical protein
MKQYLILALAAMLPLATYAQQEEEATENGIVSVDGTKGFTIASPKGDFVFKPYALIQTTANFNYYDDEGLDKAYNQDNVMNSGFAIPYAILGFTGKVFDRISFNLSLNAAGSGGALLQQAWFDVKVKNALCFRVGKFKTPYTHAYLTTLGETLFPVVPTSLTTNVIMPYVLNAVNPTIGTGFDLGVMAHGVTPNEKFGYEVGLFNGTGAGVNNATKTLSDDIKGLPSLLYAGRIAVTPLGHMPASQGKPNLSDERKLLFALSANVNVEAQSESTNDARFGFEFAYLAKKLYLAAEFYRMHISYTDRQKISDEFNYWGAYIQAGYFVAPQWQIALRYDFMDRNATAKDGIINMPAAGFNYFIKHTNLKLQTMYQYMGRTGHQTQLDRDNDDLGLATHSATVMLQYAF